MNKVVIFDLNGLFFSRFLFSKVLADQYWFDADTFMRAFKHCVMDVVHKKDAPPIEDLLPPLFQEFGITLSPAAFLEWWFSNISLDQAMLALLLELQAAKVRVVALSNGFRERSEYVDQKYPELVTAFTARYFSW